MSRVSTFYEPIQLINRSTPTTPATDRAKLYLKNNVLTYVKSTGVEVGLDPVTNGDHLYLADKDATAVSFGFTNASGTGFFRNASLGYIGFAVDGTERANLSTTGLTLAGNLTVNGTMTTIDSTVVSIADNMVVVNSGQAYLDGGYAVKRDLTSITSDTPFASGTCQVGSSGLTIVLAAGASAVDDYYNNMYVKTTGGTGSGQTRLITDYDGTSKTATVSVAWDTIPDDTTTYSIYNNVYVANIFHESSKEIQYLYLTSQAASSFTGTFADAKFNQLTLNSKLVVPDGSTSAPSVKVGSTESGLSYGTSALRVSVGGSEVANYAAATFNVLTDLAVTGKTSISAGTVLLPSLYLGSDTTTGLYRIGANQIGVSVAAAKILDISSSSFAVTSSAGRLAFSVENDTGNALVTGTLGVTGTITASNGIMLSNGSVSTPSLYFGSETTTGLYRIGANNVGLSISGSNKMNVSSTGSIFTGNFKMIKQGYDTTPMFESFDANAPDGTIFYQGDAYIYGPNFVVGNQQIPQDYCTVSLRRNTDYMRNDVPTESGTAVAGSTNTITLAGSSSSLDNRYNGYLIKITGGTGSGQFRIIKSYVGSSKIATVTFNWSTPPDDTSTYELYGNQYVTFSYKGYSGAGYLPDNEGVHVGYQRDPSTTDTPPYYANIYLGKVFAKGNLVVNSSAGVTKFSVQNDTGNASTVGTLGVAGAITTSGQLLMVSGSAAAPEITFLGDTDTGIYRPGSNELALALGGKDALKLSVSTSGGAIMRQCESSSGHVCDYNYVRLGEVAAVSTPAAVPLAVINVPDGGKCAVVVDAYELDANNAYEALSTTHVVYASGTTVTDSPVFSAVEDATWTLTTGSNTLTLNLLPNDSDTNNYTKYFNVKIRLQPMNNTACTIVDA